MNNNSTYRSWCSYALSLLLFWISTGQVLGWGHCSCVSHTEVPSCCAKKGAVLDKKASFSYKKGVQIQNVPCCCQQVEEQTAFSPLEQVLELSSIGALLPVTTTKFVVPSTLFAENAYTEHPTWRHYAPPPLYRDIPIFVQSFLL